MAEKPNHSGHRARLRQTYLRGGIDSLSDVNRLELLLFYAVPRRDTNQLAHALLQEFGSFSAVMGADVARLTKVDGISENAAVLIQLVGQLSACAERERAETRSRGILDTTDKCAEYLLPHFFGLRAETVYILCLDGKCKLLACRKLGEGSINAADISTRKIVETALHHNAVSVVLAHNHPNGICRPSAEDESTTLRIWHALDAVDIQLVDHIIVCGADYCSMADAGFFESFLRR